MWGHYGCKHTGMVIGFETNIDHWGGNNFFSVTYQDDRLQLNSDDDNSGYTPLSSKGETHLLCTKALCWSYEREWRF